MPIFKRTFAQDLDLLEQHLTKEIISQTDCKTILTKLRTTFENAFNSEFKARMQKYTRFDAQSLYDAMICNMDSIGKYMLEITLHQQRTLQLLKEKKLMQTQEDHSNPIQELNIDSLKVDFSSLSSNTHVSEKEDNNSEDLPTNQSGNDTNAEMHISNPFSDEEHGLIQLIVEFLYVAKKKIQERDRNSTTSVTTSARIQTTADDSKPKPRSNNQTSRSLPVSKSSRITITAVPKADHSKSSSSFSDSKQFVCSTCQKCIFNANHDACITKLLKEVNSRAKIQSHKTRNSNKPVDQKNHTQKPGRQIFTGHRFSPNKTSAVYEKTSPRSDLRWKPTGRIFKSVGLRWIPTGKLFDSCTSKVDSEPPHGSNVDIHPK
ncbi:hypothetical protein Tco_1303522 [Tanacetum coccineum]